MKQRQKIIHKVCNVNREGGREAEGKGGGGKERRDKRVHVDAEFDLHDIII